MSPHSWRIRIRGLLDRTLRRIGRHVPVLRTLVADAEAAREAFRFVGAGHYYSPIPSPEQIQVDARRLASARPRELPGIDLSEGRQLALLERLRIFYRDIPFPSTKIPERRYFFKNPAYSYSDAICLYGMIRHVQPRRIIEVGSGYSSCVTLDTNELFFGNQIGCTFVEPFPALLRSLIKSEDLARIEIIASPLQNVELARFRELEENDILFIDSTHVSKVGSDVNYIFTQILPMLRRGVYVHFHDIFYPFEYPPAWLKEGRVWTEAYLLRAFLAFNSAYEIVLFNTFLEHFHRSYFEEHMPLCLKNEGGSIWLRRRS
jgi:predicted O-methyltransferase YrrM